MSRNFELMRRMDSNSELIGSWAQPKPVWSRPAETIEEQGGWIGAVAVLRKHWRTSAGFAAVVFFGIATATLFTKPTYEPAAQIEVEAPGNEQFSLQGGAAASNPAEYVATQAQKLEGDELAVKIIRALRLDKNPELSGRFATDTTPTISGSDITRLSKAEGAALNSFRSQLRVRHETNSRLITVSFASHDPRLAASVTNELVDRFADQNYKERYDTIQRSSVWLARQLDDIRRKMDDSNRALADFQKQTGIADLGENGSTFSQQVGELNRQLTQAQAERIQMESFLGRLKNSGPQSLPQVGANPVMQNLTQKLAERRSELAKSFAIYGSNHPTIKKLQSEVNELQAQLDEQRRSIVAELGTSFAAARARERLFTGQVKGTTQELNQMAQYSALKKEADANAQLYSSLYAKVKEAGIAAASKSSNVRVVNRARILNEPSRPHRLLNIAVGLLAGLIGGVVLAFVREGFDNRIYTPEDVRKYTGISTVSVVPLISTDNNGKVPWLKRALLSADLGGAEAEDRFFLERFRSPEAEALRGIYSSILLARNGNPHRVVLLASPLPGEGKTTIAINLSSALARYGRTCIVDADLRKPGVGSAFKLESSAGIMEILSDSMSLDDALSMSFRKGDLTVLQAGAATPDPGQLFWSHKLRALVRELRERFDFVIVDAPPLLPYADGRALAPTVDGVIFVCRPGLTTRGAMVRGLELLTQVRSAPVLDIVLNATNSFSANYQYYNGYTPAVVQPDSRS